MKSKPLPTDVECPLRHSTSAGIDRKNIRNGSVQMEVIIIAFAIGAMVVLATQLFGDRVLKQFSLAATTMIGQPGAGESGDGDGDGEGNPTDTPIWPEFDPTDPPQGDGPGGGGTGGDGPSDGGPEGDSGPGGAEAADGNGSNGVLLPLPGLNTLEAGQTVEVEIQNAEQGPFKRVTVTSGVSGLGGVGLQNPILNEVGNSEITLTFEVGADTGYTGSQDGKVVGVGGEIYGGGNLAYSVTMPESAYEDIRNGNLPHPLLGDPSTWPIGSQVLITAEAVVGTSMEASYRQFMIENGIEESAGLVVGMTRLDDGTVRMYIGDTASVSQYLFTGIGTENFNIGIGNDTQLRDSHLFFRDVNFNHPDADTPIDLLHSGTFGADSEAVLQSGEVELLTFTSATSLDLQLGPVGGSFELGENGGRAMVITHEDGSQDIEFFTSYHTGQGTLSQSSVDVEGNVTMNDGLYYDTVSPNSEALAHLSIATDTPYTPPSSDATLQIKITPALMTELSERYTAIYEQDPFIVHAANHFADINDSSQLNLGTPEQFLALLGRGIDSSHHLSRLMSAIATRDGAPIENVEYEIIQN